MEVRPLGLRDYGEVWELQKSLAGKRAQGLIADTLLLVEHPHVVTCGRAFKGRTVPGTASRKRSVGEDPVPVLDVDRGGDVTYHGPGQLVGYPIVHLKEAGIGVAEYLRLMERALIEAVLPFGIRAERAAGFTGIWAGGRKLASIGIGVRRWVTFHGFALNVNTDLEYFRLIYPCGLEPSTLTSLERLLGRRQDMEAVERSVAGALARLLTPAAPPRSAAGADVLGGAPASAGPASADDGRAGALTPPPAVPA